MKKILKLAVLPLLFLSVVSCSSDDENTVATPVSGPELISPEDGTAIVLDPDLNDNPAITFVWNHAGYDVATEVNYRLEVALANTDFATPIPAGAPTTSRVAALTVSELNTAAINAGLEPFEAGELDVRVVATLGSNSEMPMESNTIMIVVTPYTTEAPKLYLRGNFLSASGYGTGDWGDNASPPFIQAASYGETAYEGYIYMNVPAPEFKIIPNAVDFAGDYGDADASGASGTLVQEGESNIKAPAAGYYLVQANLDPEVMSYSLTPTTWGVTGSGTPNGWPDNGIMDHDMTYNPDTKVWTVVLALSAGEIKFRANDAWAINYGDEGTNGTLEFNNGTNIPVTAGTYLITLNLSNPGAYTYTLTPQ